MTDRELADAFGELRLLCTNIIGFHIEAERESNAFSSAERVLYEAQVYAGGLTLAHRVVGIADALQRRVGH